MPKPNKPLLKLRLEKMAGKNSLELEIKAEFEQLQLQIDDYFAKAQKRIRIETEKKV